MCFILLIYCWYFWNQSLEESCPSYERTHDNFFPIRKKETEEKKNGPLWKLFRPFYRYRNLKYPFSVEIIPMRITIDQPLADDHVMILLRARASISDDNAPMEKRSENFWEAGGREGVVWENLPVVYRLPPAQLRTLKTCGSRRSQKLWRLSLNSTLE